MTEEKRTAGSRDLSSAAELYEVYDNCDNEERDDQWQREQQKILLEEAMGIKRFHTIDSDVLFEKQLEKRRYIVKGLLPEGLTVLSGDPKVGKSFFALSLSVSVAKGIPFLCFPTVKSDVLYFSFEDDEKRLQQRLFEMSEDNFTGLTFSSDVMHLDVDFIQSVENYLQNHPSTKLIVVDTLNYIRPDKPNTNMYKNDYDDMIKLHRLTQQYGIAMLLLHHNRKNGGSDDLHTISGSTGLTGGADNCIIIERPKRGEKIAKLKVISRDMESFEMEIMQGEGGIWIAAEDKELAEKEISVTVRAVYLFYTLTHFSDEPLVVSPTELSESINRLFSISIPPTMIKKNLTADHEDLESLGLKFDYERTKQGRKLLFSENDNYRKPKYFYFDEKGKFVFDAFFSSEYEDGLSGDSGDRVTGETDSENISSSTVNCDEPFTETDEKNADECQDNVAPDTSENDSGDSSDDTVTADSRCENNCQPVNRCQPVAENNKKPVQNCGGNRKKHGKKSKKKKGGKKH